MHASSIFRRRLRGWFTRDYFRNFSSGASPTTKFVSSVYIFANSYITVEFNGSESNSWKVSREVQQGDVLSALLFEYIWRIY